MSRIKLYEQFIQEMSITDHRVQRILDYMKTANGEEVKRCKRILTSHEDSTIQDVLSTIKETGYEEMQDLEEEIFGPDNVDKKHTIN